MIKNFSNITIKFSHTTILTYSFYFSNHHFSNYIWLLSKPGKITGAKRTPTTEIKRSLLAFTRKETIDFLVDELIIETARHIYTVEYIELTKDFYLKM